MLIGTPPLVGMMAGTSTPKCLLLMHMDGSNGGTTFTDDVVANSWAATGATTSTTQTKFGATSMKTDTADDYVQSGGNIVLPAGDFTFEYWHYITSDIGTSTGAGIANTTSGDNFACYYQASGSANVASMFLYMNGFGNGIYATGVSLAQSTWHHVAWVMSGSTGTIYLNGTALSTTTDSGFPLGFNNVLRLGYQNGAARSRAYGYLDEMRLSNVARYTGNFTPSASAFILD